MRWLPLLLLLGCGSGSQFDRATELPVEAFTAQQQAYILECSEKGATAFCRIDAVQLFPSKRGIREYIMFAEELP